MSSFVNNVVTTLFTSIILILFYQIIIICGQFADPDSMDGVALDDDFPASNNYNDMLGAIRNQLNNYIQGTTFQYADLINMISNSKRYDDQCELQLGSGVSSFLGYKLIIGQLSNVNQIIYVQISFHDDNGDFIRDDEGNPIIYKSNRQELGHVLDILHQGFAFNYAKCLLKLQPNCNFDLHSLFFHFAQQQSSTISNNNNLTGIITGPTSFSIDSLEQMYNVSINCPVSLTCMWLLDGKVISTSSNTSIILTFDPKYIGNRTLSYVVYIGNNPRIIASLLLSILPSTKQVCNPLLRSTGNRWMRAGGMSSPRVYFTVTYLSRSRYMLIAGGTADYLNALSSVDIYDPTTGCYNLSNMTYPRMKHTAAYFDNSDMVLLMGGAIQEETSTKRSELFSLNGSQNSEPMLQARYFHEIAVLQDFNIFVVGGRGLNDSCKTVEMYDYESSFFQYLDIHSQKILEYVEGHSVTYLGTINGGSALIFGGHNNTAYINLGLILNETSLTAADEIGPYVAMISPRAHHQATFIPTLNAVLITGGDDGINTFSTCYLYHVDSKTFNITGSMKVSRSFHAAVLLSDNSVLIIGGGAGLNGDQPSDVLGSVERYNPVSQTFTFVAHLNDARYGHKAVALPNGAVFVFGGIASNGRILSSIEYLTSDSLSINPINIMLN